MSSDLRRRTRGSPAAANTSTASAVTAATIPASGLPLAAWLLPLLAVRLLSALFSPIPDCDEVFNYWEPTHYLLYGQGLQTWEYSPDYALRSYFYCAFHAALAAAVGVLTSNKVAIFYAVRCALGAASALVEARFARRVAQVVGTEIGVLTWLLLLTSAGMFHASVAFLPSTFAMVLLTRAWTCWLGTGAGISAATATGSTAVGHAPAAHVDYAGAIWSVAIASILGWPFAGIVAAGPLAIDALVHIGPVRFLRHAASAAAALILPSAAMDSFLYGRPVLAFLNILLYNKSASEGSGSQLYGIEPWHYYLHNLALNFNAALPAALAAPLLLLVRAALLRSAKGKAAKGGRASGSGDDAAGCTDALPTGRLLLVMSALYLWLGFFSLIPHKEERFMSPVYPLICLAAAVAVSSAARIVASTMSAALLPSSSARRAAGERAVRIGLAGGAIAVCAALSAMRAAGQITYYGAPLRLYAELSSHLSRVAPPPEAVGAWLPPPIFLCVGNEWYRFPSSFFLPPGVQLAFVKDGFRGQLPAHYASPAPAGARVVPSHFNDMNREEASRYIPLEQCDVLADLLPLPGSDDEHERAKLHRGLVPWRTAPFLDAAHSPSWSRALYIPMLSARRNLFVEYALLISRKRAAGDVNFAM